MNDNLFGSIINAVPLDKMFAVPLLSMIDAQIQSSKAYAEFIASVCVEDGKAKVMEFSYEETLLDGTGKIILDEFGSPSKTLHKVSIPLIAAVNHPCILIEEGKIDFEIEVTQVLEDTKATEGEGEIEGSAGWGPFRLSLKGRLSHKSEQTRKTDTRARYSVSMLAKKQDIPEAMSRIIENISNSYIKPITE